MHFVPIIHCIMPDNVQKEDFVWIIVYLTHDEWMFLHIQEVWRQIKMTINSGAEEMECNGIMLSNDNSNSYVVLPTNIMGQQRSQVGGNCYAYMCLKSKVDCPKRSKACFEAIQKLQRINGLTKSGFYENRFEGICILKH